MTQTDTCNTAPKTTIWGAVSTLVVGLLAAFGTLQLVITGIDYTLFPSDERLYSRLQTASKQAIAEVLRDAAEEDMDYVRMHISAPFSESDSGLTYNGIRCFGLFSVSRSRPPEAEDLACFETNRIQNAELRIKYSVYAYKGQDVYRSE